MFPYEILVGLKRTMCICAHGLVKKHRSLKELNIEVQNFYNFSTNISKTNSTPKILFCKDLNNIKKFHTQLSSYCLTSSKDLKSIEFNDKPVVTKKSLENLENSNNEETQNIYLNNILNDVPKSIKNWLLTTTDIIPSKDIEKKFPEPKAYLHNIYNTVSNETQIAHCLTSNTKLVNGKKKQHWSFTYEVKWPENKSFTTIAYSKSVASHSAALKCLYWLHLNNRLHNRSPIIYDKKKVASITNTPEELKIKQENLNEINKFLDKYEESIQKATFKINKKEELFVKNDRTSNHHPISHFRVNIDDRNKMLQERLENRNNVSGIDLPIFNYKSQILKELDDHQALVIKGDTGCGKTTKVPQFIIDHMSAKGKGSDCKIIVTQPRRISAISLAQWIARDREESVGDVVGYQVRLQQVLPKQNGAILFCTTGILLKKLQSNLYLKGCSHIIIDEAHERNVDTDMLLVLLKRAMENNPDLKIIIMSATINADLFQQYLGCNAIEVPGRLFPVQTNFLEDINKLGIMSVRNDTSDVDEPIVDCYQIADLIQWISNNKPPGAILCFLPGWSQIQKVQMILEENSNNNESQLIIPLHSKLPYAIQSKIFEPTSNDVRKIILATDIAETGITVPDVIYVVDSACHNEVRWHESKGLSSVDTHWVSRANLDQRKGRAGRVQKGESYHLITKKKYYELAPYPIPEVLRVSLEKTVLDAKTYSNEKAENFLGSMPQPPKLRAVKQAVDDLEILGALDENENLTPLGKKIALFTMHPKLSKAMVYGSIFQCLSPVATISSALSLDSDIFYGSLYNKSQIRQIKEQFHPCSDHLAVAWIYSQWADLNKPGTQNAYRFCKKNRLSSERMMILHKVRNINFEHLRESGLIHDANSASHLQAKENKYAVLDEFVRGILLTGIDQILKHRDFNYRKGRFTKNDSSMVTEDGAKAQLTPESVNYKRQSWPSPYLVYYQKTHHLERRTTLIRESSILSPVTVILFSQGQITGTKFKDENHNEDKILLQISGKENVRLICDEMTAKAILRFRDVIWSIARYYVENNLEPSLYDENKLDDLSNIEHYKSEMLNILANLLNSASKPIDLLNSES